MRKGSSIGALRMPRDVRFTHTQPDEKKFLSGLLALLHNTLGFSSSAVLAADASCIMVAQLRATFNFLGTIFLSLFDGFQRGCCLFAGTTPPHLMPASQILYSVHLFTVEFPPGRDKATMHRAPSSSHLQSRKTKSVLIRDRTFFFP